jgi:rod shape-determining protein MreD
MRVSRNKIITLLIFFIFFILQTTVFEKIKVYNVKPNIIIVLIICYSLAKGSIRGGTIGLIAGIVIDIITGKIFGLHTFICFYTGLLAGLLYKRFFRESYMVIIVTTFVFTIFYEFLFYFMKYYIWTETGFGYAMKMIILPEAIYNSILVVPVRFLLLKIDKWFKEDVLVN